MDKKKAAPLLTLAILLQVSPAKLGSEILVWKKVGFLQKSVMHISEEEVTQRWTGEGSRPTVTFSTDIKAIWLVFIIS